MARPVTETTTRRTPPRAGDNWFRIENAIVRSTDDAADGTPPPVAEIYIYDEIGMWGTSADDFIQQMMAINSPAIELHLNSPGGAVFDGVAIYNALKSHPANVSVYVDALAASAASFIAMAADEDQLYMARNATMMIHDASALVGGNADDMIAMADILNKLSNNIADMYAQRAGGTVDEWRAFMQAETWYNSSEAVEAGLADSVTGQTDETTNKWDMTKVYNHAGRSDAPSPREVRELLLNTGGIVTTPDVGTTAAGGAPTPPSPPALPVVAPAAATTVQAFNIGGVQISDPVAIQNQITMLETFRDESKKEARKAFVNSLAAGPAPKILASGLDKQEVFALSLSDEQYELWKASWDAAAPSSVLGNIAVGTPNADGQTAATGEVSAEDDRIEVLQGIIKMHKDSGLKPDVIEAMESYKELQFRLNRRNTRQA